MTCPICNITTDWEWIKYPEDDEGDWVLEGEWWEDPRLEERHQGYLDSVTCYRKAYKESYPYKQIKTIVDREING